MILGMTTFTFIHVLISLIGIFSGLVVLCGLLTGKRMNGWTAIFLISTVATSVTGFMFPYKGFTPGIGVGILSLIVLVIAIVARYSRHLDGGWRRTYVINAVIALYFNVFVLIAQLFEKVPSLHVLAPKGNEPPFAVTQGIVVAVFIVLGVYAVKGFREPMIPIAQTTKRAA
jgi:hypothetical protein